MRSKLIILFLFLVFCLTAAPLKAAEPKDCLLAIENAVENGNTEQFSRLVDLDVILNHGLNVFLQEVQQPENLPYLPPMFAMMFTQAANQQAIRQLLLQETRAFVLNGIASGAFAGKKLAPAQQQGLLAPLFAQASIGRKEISKIGDALKDGDGWLLPFTIHDYGNDQDYAVIGRFVQNDGFARLTDIANLEQLFAQIRREMS